MLPTEKNKTHEFFSFVIKLKTKNRFNYINFSRLTDSGATPGVNVPALSSALVAGQVNFV